MTTFTHDLSFVQAETVPDVLTWTADDVAVNLTGCTAKMQIRETFEASTALATVDTSGGGIVLGGTAGTITLNIPAATTATLTPGTFVYDILLTWPSGAKQVIVRGTVMVLPRVTQ